MRAKLICLAAFLFIPLLPPLTVRADDGWDRAYSRVEGCFPAGSSRTDKYWCPVGRVDNVYGDRNLVCSCPPVAEYAEAAE